MLRLLPFGLLAGCQVAFPLEEPPGACAGNSVTSLLDVCAASNRALEPGPVIDTGDASDPDDLADCSTIVVQEDVLMTPVCVIAGRSITIGNTLAIGSRPLVLIAADDLLVVGSLSVASRGAQPTGAGANFLGCAGVELNGEDAANNSGGGGGAGGSFGNPGAEGGAGIGSHAGGMPVFDSTPLAFLRGGCPGGRGGTNTAASTAPGGAGGEAGGAMYLVAGGAITIAGLLDASGHGGEGGSSGSSTGGGGGGGGGSGGLIALDAPAILLAQSAKLIANGGGGGGGGPASTSITAGDGSSPDATMFPFSSLGGDAMSAGNGGAGADANTGAHFGNANTMATGGAGGGGGGGLGHILIFGELDDRGAAASPVL